VCAAARAGRRFASELPALRHTPEPACQRGPGTFRPLEPDIVAPGAGIRSAINTCDTCYAPQDGTSMATPHVSGAVALLLSAQPGLGYTEIYRALVTSAAQTLGAPPGSQACGGRSSDVFPNAIYGFGRLDAAAAVGLP
jgi:serine protease AprX